MPGFEQFLGATPYATLKEVSRDGPVVILLDHESCCSAIVLASPDVEPKCVPLTVTVKKLVALHARMKKVADSRGRIEDNLELVGNPGADTAYRAPRAESYHDLCGEWRPPVCPCSRADARQCASSRR